MTFPTRCECSAPGRCDKLGRVVSAGILAECQSNGRFRLRMAGVPADQWPAENDVAPVKTNVTPARIDLGPRRTDCIHFGKHVKTCNGIPKHECPLAGLCTPVNAKSGTLLSCWDCKKYEPKGAASVSRYDSYVKAAPLATDFDPNDSYAILRDTLPAGMPSDDVMRAALKRVSERRTEKPAGMKGRGIVYAAGGWRFMCGVFVSVRMLRWLGCEYPVEVWYNGDLPGEFDPRFAELLARLGVTFHDAAEELRRLGIARRSHLGGWPLKPLAYLLSSFDEVLGLDADCYPVLDPRSLFDDPRYHEAGAILWPDLSKNKNGGPLKAGQWNLFGLEQRHTPGIESGQVLIDKRKRWHHLAVAAWLNDHHDFCYLPQGRAGMLGDKDTFAIGFHAVDEWGGSKTGTPYVIAPPTRWLHVAFMQHDLDRRVMFVHRCRDKPRVGSHSYGTPQNSGAMIRCDGDPNKAIAHEWKVHELVAEFAAKMDAKPVAEPELPKHDGPRIPVLVPMIYRRGLHPDLMQSMRDGLAMLERHNPAFRLDVRFYDEPFTNEPGERIWAKVGRARNAAIDKFLLPEHEYVLWIDADMVSYPRDLLTRLHAANPDGITAPAVMIEGDRLWYDWAAFVEQVDGELHTFTPEPPHYRSTPENGRLEVRGVGSLYLAPAWPYRKGVKHADTPYADHWPLCEAVREAAGKIVCLTDVRAEHAELPRYAEAYH